MLIWSGSEAERTRPAGRRTVFAQEPNFERVAGSPRTGSSRALAFSAYDHARSSDAVGATGRRGRARRRSGAPRCTAPQGEAVGTRATRAPARRGQLRGARPLRRAPITRLRSRGAADLR